MKIVNKMILMYRMFNIFTLKNEILFYTTNLGEMIKNGNTLDYRFNENRPFSFTSRNYFYTHKGLDYILGNSNPNNSKVNIFQNNQKNLETL